ncbi:3-oxoacyl-[acyl-carrier protein] reductase [Sporosarcina luteola]|nr:3-oxoacyl-[acyl-carrier protein] reductase [Sporosarcina luteola]
MTTVIITGASRGIGRATAVKLSHCSQVDNMVLIATNYDGLLETQRQMSSGVHSELIVFDLSQLWNIDQMVQSIYDKYGSIDWLLNIAGYADPQLLLDTTIDNLSQTFTVNFFSMAILTKAVVKFMKLNEQSQIVNVASTAGSTPRPGWSAYAASKAAVINFSETLSEELAEYHIAVYCVSPGRTATDLRKRLAPEEDPTTIMQPEDVAYTIYTLLTDETQCLAGQDLIVRNKKM